MNESLKQEYFNKQSKDNEAMTQVNKGQLEMIAELK